MGSDEYFRTTRRIIATAQAQVAHRIRTAADVADLLDEEALFGEISLALDKAKIDDVVQQYQLELLRISADALRAPAADAQEAREHEAAINDVQEEAEQRQGEPPQVD